ncbi:Fungalysin metallopeptidase-domain-containing protein [Syncephalis fuscata]|nr:Fungalysin metallopeptidase-domain-containing protein [Syncephalis fuscata]
MHADLRVASLILAFSSITSAAIQRIEVKPIVPHVVTKSAVRSLSSSLSEYKPPPSFSPRSPQDTALQFARSQLSVKDGDFVVTSSYKTQLSGTTHVYLQQTIKGIKVFNGKVGIHVDKANKIIAYDDSFFKDNSANKTNGSAPDTQARQSTDPHQAVSKKLEARQLKTWSGQTNGFVSPVDAFGLFASYINRPFDASKVIITPQTNPSGGQSYLLKGVQFAIQDVEVTQSYIQANANELVPAWEYSVKMPLNYFHVHISADGRKIISMVDKIRFASYRVNKLGENNPVSTPRELVVDPADKIASPNGWHVQGTKRFTTTIGNNVYAQENYSNKQDGWKSNYRPDGGKDLKFDFPFDARKAPKDNINAAITNLFYVNNIMHDVFYRYGFDEAAGNFQEDNGSKGGLGGDAIAAHALDSYDLPEGSETRNNAALFPEPDGKRSVMVMFGFNGLKPDRDGDLENDIVSHEYGHGISHRLTGGPASISCMDGEETAAWTKASDKPTKNVEMGWYVTGQNIRNYPYSTNMATNPLTYNFLNDSKWLSEPHNMGEVWANMLYEVYWALVNKLGFHKDKYSADVTKGNTLALQLVIDGLKLQPCNPTFTNARDAILQAEQQLTGGKHACDIWKAFAKRGLGVKAAIANDGNNRIASNDVPTRCKA